MNSLTEYSESDAIVVKNLIKVSKCIGVEASIQIGWISVTIIKFGSFKWKNILSTLKSLNRVFVYTTTLSIFTASNITNM